MKVTKKENVMILGISSYESKNGTVYYNCDLYDMDSGSMYSCGVSLEIFNSLAQQPKPLMVNECVLDIRPQYQNQSRIELIAIK